MRLYVEQKQVREMDRAQFAELLQTIDRKITRDYDAAAWLRLLAPLFDLVRRAGAGPGVPVPLLQVFFEEKQADEAEQRLRMMQQHRGVETLDEADLRRLLEAVDEPAPVQQAAQPAVASPRGAAASDEAEGPVPRWKQYQQDQPRPLVQPPRPQRGLTRAADETPSSVAPHEAQPRWMQFRAEAEPETPAPASPYAPMDLAAVERAVLGAGGARNRDVFVNNLFAHSIDDYERVLRHLRNASTWAEASQIIAEEVFRRHQVNIYSDPAILFTDTVEAGFLEG